MFRWLRSGNPYHVIILLVYAICIKYFYLVHPLPVVAHPESEGGLYRYILHYLQGLSFGPVSFALLAFILLFIEAILLNTVVNRFKLLPANSYFPAFCYLLFTSFFPEWNVFSAPLLANLLLVVILPQLLNLYSAQQPRSSAFSLGFFMGIGGLIYAPVLAMLALIWIALLVSRPFRLAEWVVAVVGVLCPYYFLCTILFLLDKLSVIPTLVPAPALSYPDLLPYPWVLGGAVFLLIWFLYGNIRMQQDHMKMMIHARKCWQILLAFVTTGFILAFLPDRFSFSGWLVAFLPMAVFIAMAFWHIQKGWLAMAVHLCALAYVFVVQWVY